MNARSTALHLVGHDGTRHGDDALALARALATGRDVRRVVLHVVSARGETRQLSTAQIDELDAEPRERVAEIGGRLGAEESLEVVEARSPARGLHDWAEERDADLVVVGAHHLSTSRLHLTLSTVAANLLAGGPCAVAHAPAGYAESPPPFRRIVVGFDGSDESRGALAEAAAIAAAGAALVDVIYVYDHTAFPRYPGTVAEAEAAADVLARSGLEAIPDGVRGVSAVRSGVAGTTIEHFAEAQAAELIVLGSRGFGPVCRAVIGSTGSHVMRHTDRPVLILPRGARRSGIDREPPGAPEDDAAPSVPESLPAAGA